MVVDGFVHEVSTEFLSEVVEVYVYGIVRNVSVSMAAPHLFDKLVSTEHFSLVRKETFENEALVFSQVHFFSIYFRFPGRLVESNVLVGDARFSNVFARASEHGLHARYEHFRDNWLDEIIIRSEFQSVDNVFVIAVSGNHDYGDSRTVVFA